MKKRFALLMAALLLLTVLTACDSSDYKKATEIYQSGSYLEAAAMFEELGDYEDSSEQALNCRYDYAASLFDSKEYEAAAAAFAELDGFRDSADRITECRYLIAEDLFQAGNYAEAIPAYEALAGYKDADEKLAEAQLQQMYITYAPVFTALDGGTWFFASTSVNEVKSLAFTDRTVTEGYIFYDGNGPHSGAAAPLAYTVDDTAVTVTTEDGILAIPYTMDGDQLKLGEGDFFTPAEVDAALQGYWSLLDLSYNAYTGFVTSEYIYYYENGYVKYESATVAYTGDGYFYYGPYEGTYTVDGAGMHVDARNNWQFGFVISEGKVVMCRCGSICEPATGFKGENGFSF